MQIKDMTDQQLQALIRDTVNETLDNYFGDPDEGKEVKQAFMETLLEIQGKRKQGRQTISAEEVYRKYEIGNNGLLC
ncbi:hypothetical protein [Cyanothece sp. BG0011]|uniref:hypothetical protein n=1 Tax=Cyanothece sp. BG0011 TaxID=2082950 RepID=UPI000D1FCCEB|nr:hypothetical protein [Cyanothece sp. BG0011]